MLTSISNAVNGIQNNLRGFAQHSGDVNRGFIAPDRESPRPVDQVENDGAVDVGNSRRDQPSIEQSIAGMVADKHGVQANVAVLKTADKMIGSLLDVVG